MTLWGLLSTKYPRHYEPEAEHCSAFCFEFYNKGGAGFAGAPFSSLQKTALKEKTHHSTSDGFGSKKTKFRILPLQRPESHQQPLRMLMFG